MAEQGMTYANVGVDYDAMDPFKRAAQASARLTAKNLDRWGYAEVGESRGESAYLIDTPFGYLAHVEEGLGTKELVADAMYARFPDGDNYYFSVAQDTVAMIVNDMITVGAMPLSVGMHVAAASSDWFDDERRSRDLIAGWANACNLAMCAWGPGETPTLKGVVVPGTTLLCGSAIGRIWPKGLRIIDQIKPGDAIIFIESSGIHANGLTMARKIADALPDGYATPLADGRMYGEALLDPTPIYVPAIHECQYRGIQIHYAINVTGHGWRKTMRATRSFAYVIDRMPTPQPIFAFMQKHGPIDDREAYANFNMGAGFALIVDENDAERTVRAIKESALEPKTLDVFVAGHVEASDVKKVVIKPLGLEYGGDTLGVR
jgi:phosphoribosylformylglycinamidine cyclo-ligase